MSFDAVQYFTTPARAALSPSSLSTEAAIVRRLTDACLPDLAPASDDMPWEWNAAVAILHRASHRSAYAARALKEARGFLAHLVSEGVLPLEGAGVEAVVAVARSRRPGRHRKAESLLSHISPRRGQLPTVVGRMLVEGTHL